MAALDFDLSSEQDANGRVRIAVRGELDLATAGQLEEAIARADGRPLLVDLRGLSFMDSTGVRILLQASDDASRTGAELGFVMPENGDARLTMVETGIHAILPLADPPEESA
jgi:anti-sigma B factor antagonist